MEETIAGIISNFLISQFNSHKCDIENIFSNVHFLLQILSKFWSKMQISNTYGAPHQVSCNKEISGDGKEIIDIVEVNWVMKKLGIGGGFENNGEIGGVCDEEFFGLFDEEEPSLEEIKETFGVFDVNKDGFIDGSELQIVLCNLGLKCNLEECNGMIKPFDGNGDGLIDFREFVTLMEICLF
ncbi:hypothetical protein CASFOL_020781 [Castilleja foliolosa]|uniref:EF-hand domain-containing protein n=1 Tax=Castilleja foliolosa TaxID=1961234 RepID=A0ABD3D4T7_9LAMI